MPVKEVSLKVSFDRDKFVKNYEGMMMAVEELYDLVPEWKEDLADEAKSKIIKEMIALSIDN